MLEMEMYLSDAIELELLHPTFQCRGSAAWMPSDLEAKISGTVSLSIEDDLRQIFE